MLDFLKELNISEQTINELYNLYEDTNLYGVFSNKISCSKIINYMREIGITNIEEILLNKIDIFKMTYQTFLNTISRYEIPSLVKLINEDYLPVLDEIF